MDCATDRQDQQEDHHPYLGSLMAESRRLVRLLAEQGARLDHLRRQTAGSDDSGAGAAR